VFSLSQSLKELSESNANNMFNDSEESTAHILKCTTASIVELLHSLSII
jgi:hypothetical protein